MECVGEGTRGKRIYAITADDRAELRGWLVDVEPDHTQRGLPAGWLLSTVLTRVEALHVLARDIEALRERRKGLLTMMERSAAISPPHGPHNLSMDLSLRLNEAMLGWSEEAARRIAERP